jgi:uncharacterized protein YecE (DUF72 family)
MQTKADIKVGCCGFIVSQQRYFQLFKLIEIQSTFYQLPQLRTAERWRDSAPEGFEFTMKAWQLITHEPTSPTYRRLREKIEPAKFARYGRFRVTAEVLDAWHRTAMFARTLGTPVVVFQCPARFGPTRENVANMREFFSRIDREGLRFAWEPRGAWPEELVRPLCMELRLTHCVDPFKNKPQFGDFQYFRLHGITGFAYQYSDTDLQQLKKWAENKPTHLLFNNNSMEEDALRFLELGSIHRRT